MSFLGMIAISGRPPRYPARGENARGIAARGDEVGLTGLREMPILAGNSKDPTMMTLLILAALWVGLMLAYAVILFLIMRRSSWGLRPTLARAFVAGILMVLLGFALLWLLNPTLPDLAPIAVAVRTVLIAAMTALGGVRIVQLLMKTTYGHAWYLWILSHLIFAGLAAAVLFLAVKPMIMEVWTTWSNHMAPTIIGWHREDVCSLCGGERISHAGEPGTKRAELVDRIADPIGICAKCRKISEIDEPDQLRKLPVKTPDRVLVNRLLKPKRWDMIAFRHPLLPERDLDRLVGLPGETVYLKDGWLWVDGVRIEPPKELAGLEYDANLNGRRTAFGSEEKPWKLGPEECVVLGDFREHSPDSRLFGRLPTANIEGVVAITFWPPERWKIHP
jgi:signal peptidase I